MCVVCDMAKQEGQDPGKYHESIVRQLETMGMLNFFDAGPCYCGKAQCSGRLYGYQFTPRGFAALYVLAEIHAGMEEHSTTREALEARAATLDEGDLGPLPPISVVDVAEE